MNTSRLRNILLWIGFIVVLVLAVWLVPQWQVQSYNESLSLEEKLPAERLLTLENEYRKTLAQIIGGAALLVGLYFTIEGSPLLRELCSSRKRDKSRNGSHER